MRAWSSGAPHGSRHGVPGRSRSRERGRRPARRPGSCRRRAARRGRPRRVRHRSGVRAARLRCRRATSGRRAAGRRWARRRYSDQKPPSSAGPNQASRAASSNTGARSAADTCGVSMPTSSSGPSTASNRNPRRSSRPPPGWCSTSNPSAAAGTTSPSKNRTRRAAGSARHGGQGVGEARGRDAGCTLGGERRRQPGLHLAGQALLRDDGDGDVGARSVAGVGGGHERASCDHGGGLRRLAERPRRDDPDTGLPAVRTEQTGHVPHRVDRAAERAGDLAVADALRVPDVGLVDAPAGGVRGQDHLERVAAAAVAQVEGDEVLATHHTHRAEVAQSVAGRAVHEDGEDAVREARVRGPRAAAGRDATAECQVDAAAGDAVDQGRELGRVHRGVGVAERDEVGGRRGDPGGTGRTEPLDGFRDDEGTVGAGDVGRSVGRSVVDDDGPVARRGGAR